MNKAILMLEDGSAFEGTALGAAGQNAGEVILNTAVVGYQENITDPANAGKILVFTYPLIGNYGVAEKFNESKRCWVSGVVVKEVSNIYSNWQAEGSFGDFLRKEGVAAITNIDTRTLAVKIRDAGGMYGLISSGDADKKELLAAIKDRKRKGGGDFIQKISVKKITKIAADAPGPHVAVLDLGVPDSFIGQLRRLGCSITLLPYDATPAEIAKLDPDGLMISSGPEDDKAVPEIAARIKGLIGRVPMLGIALGHEVIALALGAKLNKMKTGHRGVNYPVKAPASFKGDITAQNHSFVIDENSIKGKSDVDITLRGVDDDSIEELESWALKFISTQYYPASPGFGEANAVFQRFLDILGKGGKKKGLKYAKA